MSNTAGQVNIPPYERTGLKHSRPVRAINCHYTTAGRYDHVKNELDSYVVKCEGLEQVADRV
jgi:hypothetical protein